MATAAFFWTEAWRVSTTKYGAIRPSTSSSSRQRHHVSAELPRPPLLERAEA